MLTTPRRTHPHERIDAIETVIVPLDGSELSDRALGPARSLADHVGADVLLMTTQWDATHRDGGTAGAQEHLDVRARALGLPNVDTVVIHDRPPADAILLHTTSPSDVVCMSTHGRSGVGRALLGSVAEEVVRRSEHPLLLVGPHVDPMLAIDQGPLLIAVDGSDGAEVSLRNALDWARILELEPVLLEALPAGRRIRETTRAEESAYVRALADRFCSPRGSSWRILHALDAAEALVRDARRSHAALLAMAAHGRTGLTRVALGSVVARTVHQSRCPVLVTPAPRL
jgi:nucleotide-binding universal stress UspA family protein